VSPLSQEMQDQLSQLPSPQDTFRLASLTLDCMWATCVEYRTVSLIAILIVVSWTTMSCCKNEIVVETEKGPIRGSKMKSKKGKRIFAFRGIPYAKPPVGDLRFKRSEPFGSWEGLLDGTNESKKAYQPNVLSPKSPFHEGGEDCLYLNVYTKAYWDWDWGQTNGPVPQNEQEDLPVVVFLHGGAFVVGSCESMLYGPQVLLDRDIVLVGLNYRLGPFGWLSLETDDAPGNLGLHDQYLALLWVKENIEAFGGDPNNVTLMGESAGAMSAMFHLVSPISRGLFHKLIALSGTSSSVLLHNSRTPRTYAYALAEQLGYTGDKQPQHVLEFLQKQKAIDILKKSIMFLDWDYANPMPWVPVQDTFCSDPFLPLAFNQAVESGKFQNVPVIIGSCKDEGLILSAPFYKDQERWNLLRKQWTEWAPLIFFNDERDLATEATRDIANEIGEFYFGKDVDISTLEGNEENLTKLTQMYSMSYFHSGFDEDSKLLAKSGAQVFTFLLTQPPAFSLMDIFRLSLPKLSLSFTCRLVGFNPYKKEYGVCHGDDLNFLFPMSPPFFPKSVVTQTQKKVQQNLLDCVSSFALTSRPTFPGLEKEVWTSLDVNSGEYLDFGAELKMDRSSELDRQMEFWKQIRGKMINNNSTMCEQPVATFYDKIAVERRH